PTAGGRGSGRRAERAPWAGRGGGWPRRRAGCPSAVDSPRLRIDVHALRPREAAERDRAIGGELDGEAGRSADGDDDRTARDGRLLDELERQASADAEHAVVERESVLAER